MEPDYPKLALRLSALDGSIGAGTVAIRSSSSARGRSGSRSRSISRSAASHVLVLDDDDTVSRRLARDLLSRSARSRSSTGWAAATARSSTRASAGTSARCSSATQLAYQFDLLPEAGTSPARVRQPAAVLARSSSWSSARASCRNRLALEEQGRRRRAGRPTASRSTSTRRDGTYALACDWLVACDGARSPVRRMLGLESEGQVFRDRFLIADIHMKSDFPTERWFWFDPPFHPRPVGAAAPAGRRRVARRLPARLGRRSRGREAAGAHPAAAARDARPRRAIRDRMGERVHVPVPAHGAFPPRPRAVRRRRRARGESRSARAARTAASRTRTTWRGSSRSCSTARRRTRLLDSYDGERVHAADENIRNSTRSTDFITPKSAVSRTFRDAVLRAREASRVRAQARQQRPPVGAGGAARLAAQHAGSTTDLRRRGAMVPGAPAADAPVGGPARRVAARAPAAAVSRCWRSADGPGRGDRAGTRVGAGPVMPIARRADRNGARRRAVIDDARASSRSATMRGRAPATSSGPDQHVCARWRRFDRDARARPRSRARPQTT